MTEKKIFFIRHGETGDNAKEIHQHAEVALSAEGERQADLIARRMAGVEVDLVISSPFQRARQTAERLGASLGKPVQLSDDLVECRRPSFMIGLSYSHPQVKDAKQQMLDHLGDDAWHHSDEENLYDWKARAERVRNLLESADGTNILVVSHGHFLKVLAGHLLFGELYSPALYLRTYNNMTMSNTGISEFVLDSEHGWGLMTWNDRTHLT